MTQSIASIGSAKSLCYKRAAVDRLCKRKLPYADWEAGSDHKLALKRAMWLSNDDEQGRTAITSMGRRR